MGNAEGSYEKGIEARKSGDFAEALHEWLVASDDPRCMMAIGVMYDYGEGVAKDDTKAVEWYMRAAAKGEYRAIAQLAYFSLTGAGGVAQVPDEWRTKLEAIEGKDGYADYVLAYFYLYGYGGAKNIAKASTMLQGLLKKDFKQLEPLAKQAERRLADQKAGVKEADDLLAEFSSAKASFDLACKDKRIVVSGWVNGVDRVNASGYALKFGAASRSASPRDNIIAVFYDTSGDSGVAGLEAGMFVKLDGVYVGRQPFLNEQGAFAMLGCSLLASVSEDVHP